MPQESITDTSKPNAGRIYDYLLGGSHNFEVDRQAAEKLLEMLPFLPKMARLQRWCLRDLAVELTQKRGFDVLIDFASGLPTNDHLHLAAPKGTTIIYSDWDPVVVEYGRDILKGIPNVHYFDADARHPEDLLNRPEVNDVLNGRRDVALITWGISAFISDEDIKHMAEFFYGWTDKKSIWAFNGQGGTGNAQDPAGAKVLAFYRQMGNSVYTRTLDQFINLVKPWHPETKFIPFNEWHGFDTSYMSEADLATMGEGGGGYGAYLVK